MSTRDILLDEAEKAVRQHGLNGFSYADLSNAVGIRKASIHYHFPLKSDLTRDVLNRYAKRFLTRLAQIESLSATAAEGLEQYLKAYKDALRNGSSLCLCVALSADRESLTDDAVHSLEAFQACSLEWLTGIFEAAQNDGTVASVSAPEKEAAATLALVEGAQLIARVKQDPKQFDRAVAALRGRFAQKGDLTCA